MRAPARLILLGSLTLVWVVAIPASPASAGCSADGDLYQAEVGCYYTGDQVRAAYGSGDGATWS
ncbi:MAG TPA: hypothetical protein PLP61_16100, partial [Nocardioides sp.]|uniref:hypothetical protein n=1 Tax=Nocardioides sp. TaxID=35761 RepID=UPI002BDDFFEE